MNITYIYDMGHGWFQVPMEFLRLNKLIEKVSDCSFHNNIYAYLEHDCDAALFFDKAKELGLEVKVEEREDNNIRNSFRKMLRFNGKDKPVKNVFILK